MLSNCLDCKYFHAEACACAVNPDYCKMTGALRSKMIPAELDYFTPDLSCCPDWERSPALDLLTHQLTLTRAQWRVLAEAITHQGLADALPDDLRPAAESEASGEIRMCEVVSSNIAAIGYRDGVCQVDFLSGSRYRYFEVPEWVYQEFLEADSKGRYLNEAFKIDHAFEYEQIW
jgi:KTSC domain